MMANTNKQLFLKKTITTGLLVVPLACLTAPVFAEPGGGDGNPFQECEEHNALYFAKYDWNNGGYMLSDDSPGFVAIDGDASSGTWSSNSAISVMIVKGGTLRAPTVYDPAATSGAFNNGGIDNKDISHVTFCVAPGMGSLPPAGDGTLPPTGIDDWALPPAGEPVISPALLATGVNLIAKPTGNGKIKLKLTTESEVGTAKLLIVRGNPVAGAVGSLKLTVVCEFDTGDKPYNCTDDAPGIFPSYWAAEVEDDGDYILHY